MAQDNIYYNTREKSIDYDSYTPKGLKGLNEIDDESKEAFLKAQYDAGILNDDSSDEFKEALWNNNLFIQRYGMDTFNSMSYQDRLDYMKRNEVDQDFYDTFHNYSNWDTDLSKLSYEAKQHLLSNEYRDPEDIKEDYQNAVEDIEKQSQERLQQVSYAPQNSSMYAVGQIANSIQSSVNDIFYGFKSERNEDKLKDAQAITNQSIVAENEDFINQRISEFYNMKEQGQITSNDIDKAFNEFANMEINGLPVFYQYTSRKDDTTFGIKNHIYDLEETEKIQLLSMFSVLSEKLGNGEISQEEATSMITDIINQDFQQRAYDKQNSGVVGRLDRELSDAKAIATKIASSLAMTAIGVKLVASDAETNKLFLQGLDSDGNPLPFYLTPKYWNNMDQYNVITPQEMEKIKKNGEISTSAVNKKPGEESDLFSYENSREADRMIGYIAANLALDYATGGAFAGAKMGTKAALKAAGASAKTIARTGKAIDIASDITRTVVSPLNEATLEATMQFNQQYEELLQRAQKDWDSDKGGVKTNALKEVEDFMFKSLQNAQKTMVPDDSPEGLGNYRAEYTYPLYDKNGEVVKYANSREEVYDFYNESAYNDYIDIAEDAAIDAAYTTSKATGIAFEIKNMGIERYLKKFMFAGKFSTDKSPFNVIAKEGRALVDKSTGKLVGNIAKEAGKSVVGGGIEELTDSFVEQFALAYGEQEYNNFIQDKFDANVSNLAYNVSELTAGLMGLGESAASKESYVEGIIGAMSPASVHVNPRAATLLTKKGRQTFKEGNVAQKINTLIYNPLLSQGVGTYEEYLQAQKIADTFNSKKDDMMDFLYQVKAGNDVDEATTAMEIQDSRNKQGFSVIDVLQQIEQENPEVYKTFMDDLQRVASGNITQDDIQQFYKQKGNGSFESTYGDNAEELAKEQIQQNAQELAAKLNDYKSARDAYIKKFGAPSNVTEQIVMSNYLFSQVNIGNTERRLQNLEGKIKGTQTTLNRDQTQLDMSNSSKKGEVYSYLTDQAVTDSKTELNEAIAVLQKKKDAYIKRSEELNTKLQNKKVRFGKAKIRQQISVVERSIGVINDQIEQLQNELSADGLNLEQRGGIKSFTSVDEILNLNPSDRAFVLNAPLSYFDQQSQKYIKEAQKKLSDETKEYIKDSGILQDRLYRQQQFIKSMENSDIKEWNNVISTIQGAYAQRFLSNMENYRIQKAADDFILSIKKNDDIVQKGIGLSSKVLSRVASLLTNNPGQSRIMQRMVKNAEACQSLFDLVQQGIKESNEVGNSDISEQEVTDFIAQLNKALTQDTKYIQGIKGNKEQVEDNLSNALVKSLASLPQETRDKFSAIVLDAMNKSKLYSSLNLENEVQARQQREERRKKVDEARQKKEEERKKREEERKRKQEEQQKQKEQKDEKSKSEETKKEESTTKTPNVDTTPQLDEEGRVLSQTDQQIEAELNNKGVDTDKITVGSEWLTSNNEEQNTTKESHTGETGRVLLGNTIYRWVREALEKSGELIQRKGQSESDKYSQFFDFLSSHEIDLQGIIDHELPNIDLTNKDIYPIAMRDGIIGVGSSKITLLGIEYTKDVQRAHNDSRGGVITYNGKQYLIIGNMGFNDKNKESRELYYQYLNNYRKVTKPEDWKRGNTFFVDLNYPFQVDSIDAGSKLKDDKMISLGELLSDLSTNPQELRYGNIPFGVITKDNGFMTIRAIASDVYSPKGNNKNIGVGDVFILIKGSNQKYVPIIIQKTPLYKLKRDSQFIQSIETIIREKLASTDYDTRVQGIKELSQYVYLGKTNILVGSKDNHTITLVNDTKRITTFDLTKDTFDVNKLVESIIGDTHKDDIRFNANLSLNNLADANTLKRLTEAGAINLTIKSLSLYNAQFSIREKGEQEVEEPIQHTNGDKVTIIETEDVLLGGKKYTKVNDTWFDNESSLVTDKQTINDLNTNTMIEKLGNHISVDKINKQGTEIEIHIIDDNPTNPTIVIRDKKTHSNTQIITKDNNYGYNVDKLYSAVIKAYREDNAKQEIKQERKVDSVNDNKDQSTNQKNTTTEEKKLVNQLYDPNKSYTFADIIESSKYSSQLYNLLILKQASSEGWQNIPQTVDELGDFLKSKGIPIIGITNIEEWLRNIKECK